jgi:hypothetical protein
MILKFKRSGPFYLLCNSIQTHQIYFGTPFWGSMKLSLAICPHGMKILLFCILYLKRILHLWLERTELKCIDHIPFLSALIFWSIILAASRNMSQNLNVGETAHPHSRKSFIQKLNHVSRQVSLLFDRKLVPSTECEVTWPQKRPSLKISRVTVVLLVSPERNLHW